MKKNQRFQFKTELTYLNKLKVHCVFTWSQINKYLKLKIRWTIKAMSSVQAVPIENNLRNFTYK